MQITPEQALFLRDTVLPPLENEHLVTIKVLQAIPADKADYQPDANSMSAFDLAWHMAISQMRILAFALKGDLSSAMPEKAATIDGVIAVWSETFQRNLSELKTLTGEQLARELDFRGFLQLPAVMFINFVMSHEIHHRGQLSAYLRPMGAKVPSIYGESYDAKQARLSAAAS